MHIAGSNVVFYNASKYIQYCIVMDLFDSQSAIRLPVLIAVLAAAWIALGAVFTVTTDRTADGPVATTTPIRPVKYTRTGFDARGALVRTGQPFTIRNTSPEPVRFEGGPEAPGSFAPGKLASGSSYRYTPDNPGTWTIWVPARNHVMQVGVLTANGRTAGVSPFTHRAVSYRFGRFIPDTVTLPVGSTLVIRNMGSVRPGEGVAFQKGKDAPDDFDLGSLQRDETYGYVVTEKGEWHVTAALPRGQEAELQVTVGDRPRRAQ